MYSGKGIGLILLTVGVSAGSGRDGARCRRRRKTRVAGTVGHMRCAVARPEAKTAGGRGDGSPGRPDDGLTLWRPASLLPMDWPGDRPHTSTPASA